MSGHTKSEETPLVSEASKSMGTPLREKSAETAQVVSVAVSSKASPETEAALSETAAAINETAAAAMSETAAAMNETAAAMNETAAAAMSETAAAMNETLVSATSMSSWEEERRLKALNRLCLLGEIESVGSEVQTIKSRRRRILRAALWSVASVICTLSLACGAGIVYIRATTDDQLWQAKKTKSRVVDGIWVDNETEACQNPAYHRVNFEPLVIPIKNGGGVLKGVFMRQPNKSAEVPTVIWLFGQGNNTGRSLSRMSSLYKSLGCNVIACDYKGIGGSSGELSEETLLEHGKLVLEYLTDACGDKIDLSRVFVWGHSLGVCPAMALMADPQSSQKLAGGIFENGFTSLLDMAKRREPLLTPILKLGLKYKLENVETVKNVSRPSLFLQGDADETVPPRMTSELFKWCPSETKQIGIVKGGPHSLLDDASPHLMENVKAFLDDPNKPTRPIWRIAHNTLTPPAHTPTTDTSADTPFSIHIETYTPELNSDYSPQLSVSAAENDARSIEGKSISPSQPAPQRVPSATSLIIGTPLASQAPSTSVQAEIDTPMTREETV